MGGGGDDGYERKQAETEAKKQRARDELNYQFGVGGGDARSKVDRTPFYSRTETSQVPVGTPNMGAFDPMSIDPVLLAANAAPGADVDEGGVRSLPAPSQMTVFDEAAYLQEQDRAAAEAEANNPNRGARERLYQGVRDNAFTAGKRRLDEEQQDAARRLKFELFATGNAGGSEDINQNARLKRTYDGGILDLGGKADAVKANFRQGDEATRLSLLQSIDGGMDQGTALSSAIGQMGVNADKAGADAIGTDLGRLFDTGGFLFNESQMRKGRQAGQEQWWNAYSPSSGGRSTNIAKSGWQTKTEG